MFGLFGPSNRKIEQLSKLIHERIFEISFYLGDSDREQLLLYLKNDFGLSLSGSGWIYPDIKDFVFYVVESQFKDNYSLIVEGKMKYFGLNIFSVGDGKYSVTTPQQISGPVMPAARKLKNVLAKYDNFFDGDLRSIF